MITAQASIASNPVLRSISGKEQTADQPDDARTYRTVGVDPDFYDMVDDNIISILLDACKPIFDLVSGAPSDSDPETKPSASTLKPADLLMNVAKLLVAAGFKMKEQARQEMAEEDLGGGMFDEDVKNVRDFATQIQMPQVYDAEEREQLDMQLVSFKAPMRKLRKLRTGTKLYTAEVADTECGLEVSVQSEVRAPAEQVAAYFMGWAKQFQDFTNEAGDDANLSAGDRRSIHSNLIYGALPMPPPFKNRFTLVRSLTEKLDDDTFFITQLSCEHPEHPPNKDFVRLFFVRNIMATRIGATLTNLEFKGSIHLGGSIPRSINDSVTIPVVMRSPIAVRTYFAAVRHADAFDNGDGQTLGRILFADLYPRRTNHDELRKHVLKNITMINVLRSAQAKYRVLDEFLYYIIINKMKRGSVQTVFVVETSLAALSASEAGRIARSFVMVLMTNATSAAAVDELILTFPALGELDREFRWFRPMMEGIAFELMNKVAYGVQVRAFLGAGLSFMDMTSDAYIIRSYQIAGNTGAANLLLSLLGANLFLQMLLVLCQTVGLKRNKRKSMFLEMLSVITFVKPGVDAYRVASGEDQQPGAMFGPLVEMVVTKLSEVLCEAVPGLILQLAVLLGSETKSTSAIVSVLISTASTAMTSTTVFWDIDTAPLMRKTNPKWMGLVPDSDRTMAFANVFVMCSLQIIAKCSAAALLTVTDSAAFRFYAVADLMLYYAYKIARRDFHIYIPLPHSASLFVSFLVHFGEKIVVDYTATPFLRLPLFMGGAYYTFSLVMSQASVLVAAYVYDTYATDDEAKIKTETLWTGAIVLVASWLVAFGNFALRVATKSHRHTIWSSQTGRQTCLDYFLEGKSDAEKLSILERNRVLWEEEVGEEVKAWTMENWERWDREKPDWWTPQKISTVPDEYIPPRFLAGLGGANRERRGSAAASVRESFRRLSNASEQEGGGGGM